MVAFIRFAKHNPLAITGLVMLAVLAGLVALGPLFDPLSPTEVLGGAALQRPSAAHWLGTDQFGRDVLTRVMYGGRATLVIGIVVVSAAFVVGTTTGIVAGYLGGWVDGVLMRIVDAVLAFPSLVLAIALAAALGPSLQSAMIAVAITLSPQFARVARSEALTISVQPYVEAAVSLGVPHRRILRKYIFLNGAGSLLVQATLALGTAILQTASLGFLGLGAQPPTPEWGADVSNGLQNFQNAPWVSLAPGFAILFAILSVNLIGDAAAEWINPRRRGRNGGPDDVQDVTVPLLAAAQPEQTSCHPYPRNDELQERANNPTDQGTVAVVAAHGASPAAGPAEPGSHPADRLHRTASGSLEPTGDRNDDLST